MSIILDLILIMAYGMLWIGLYLTLTTLTILSALTLLYKYSPTFRKHVDETIQNDQLAKF